MTIRDRTLRTAAHGIYLSSEAYRRVVEQFKRPVPVGGLEVGFGSPLCECSHMPDNRAVIISQDGSMKIIEVAL